jgi:hypothetical protein
MKTNIRGDIFHLAKCVLIFFIILLFQSCASISTPVKSLEGSDFNENLPGLWEGKWSAGGYSGKQHIKINKIDGNEVYLTGFAQGFGSVPDADEVYGSIENSTLLLTWPDSSCKEKYSMKKDDSNILILYGTSICESVISGSVQLKKIE